MSSASRRAGIAGLTQGLADIRRGKQLGQLGQQHQVLVGGCSGRGRPSRTPGPPAHRRRSRPGSPDAAGRHGGGPGSARGRGDGDTVADRGAAQGFALAQVQIDLFGIGLAAASNPAAACGTLSRSVAAQAGSARPPGGQSGACLRGTVAISHHCHHRQRCVLLFFSLCLMTRRSSLSASRSIAAYMVWPPASACRVCPGC